MSDDREFWKAFKEDFKDRSRARRQHNLRCSVALLEENKIHFSSNNENIHCIINAGEEVIDFWPSTGLWRVRDPDGKYQRGVFKLIALCKKLNDQ